MPGEGIKILKKFAQKELGRGSRRLRAIVGKPTAGYSGGVYARLRIPVDPFVKFEENPLLKKELEEFLGGVEKMLEKIAKGRRLTPDCAREGSFHYFTLEKK